MTASNGPTLTDSKGMGGINAQDGFDYQVWEAVSRLPLWIKTPGFECLGIEMLEDFEARFFAPHSPQRHVLDRFQAKSGVLTRTGIVDVFESFMAFTKSHPNTARVQTLITPNLPSHLAWLHDQQNRVRNARPFYRPFAPILAATDASLLQRLITEFGTDLGKFIFHSIDIDLRPLSDRAGAEATFATAMIRAFPAFDFSVSKLSKTFAAITDYMSANRGKELASGQLQVLLNDSLEVSLIAIQRLRVHIRSEHDQTDNEAIEIDAGAIDLGGGISPIKERWISDIAIPIEATAQWAREQNYSRIEISGFFRISIAFALGWYFRSVKGFEINIKAHSGHWETDDHSSSGVSPCPLEISVPFNLVNNP
jgi:hypothetical protein